MLVHVGIKRRQRKPSKFYGIAVLVFPNNDIGAGFLILQLNFIAHQFDIFSARRICGIRRNHEQTHVRAFLPANHLDNFVQTHLANINVIGRALRYCSDPVAYLKSSVGLGGPARNQTFNFRVTVLRPKHGPDAHKREAHVDTEILHVGLA